MVSHTRKSIILVTSSIAQDIPNSKIKSARRIMPNTIAYNEVWRQEGIAFRSNKIRMSPKNISENKKGQKNKKKIKNPNVVKAPPSLFHSFPPNSPFL